MLNKISDDSLQNFFETKTGLTTASLTRSLGHATIILEDCNGKHYVTFKVSDHDCKASPRERLGNMPAIWEEFLAKQAEAQKQNYFATKDVQTSVGVALN